MKKRVGDASSCHARCLSCTCIAQDFLHPHSRAFRLQDFRCYVGKVFLPGTRKSLEPLQRVAGLGFWSSGFNVKALVLLAWMSYLEGQGDLVSRLITPIRPYSIPNYPPC